MTSPHATPPPSPTYRVARLPDAWAWPDWAYVHADGTWGNRYDDPEGEYRVLYACTERLGGFLETLARFRPDLEVVAGIAAITPDPADPSALAPGEVPRSWVGKRGAGVAGLSGAPFAVVGHSETLAYLRTAMADRVLHYNLGSDVDAATIRMSAPRTFTQEVSRRIYSMTNAGGRQFAGVAYGSRLGDEITNWAIFEPASLELPLTAALDENDPDMLEAFSRFGLTLVDDP